MKLKNIISTIFVASISVGSAYASAPEITVPTDYYVMHAGGCHLARGVNAEGILEAPDAAKPQIMTITPKGDGYYTIGVTDGGFISISGQWNTTFTDDGESDKAKFKIEPVGDNFVRFRNKSNGKYLGTDNSIGGSNVYSNKSGSESSHYWWLSTDPTLEPPTDLTSYVINPNARRQTFDGWGVSLCWWANMCGKWSDEKIDEIVDWLVSPEGLNFSIFRYNIGGGDDPANANCTPHHMGKGKGLRAEMEGFKDSSDGPYIWERDAAQRKIMLKIKEKRPDAVFEAFSNSCPWYMTYSGCVAGNVNASKDNLRPEYYEEFAHYLVDVCKHYKDEYGIEFKTLDPFNEPMTNYWGANGGQEGCHFDVNSQIAFLKVLHPILKESGLSTVISASDETSVGQSVNDFIAYREAGVLEFVGQWNTHTYTADNNSRSRISALCNEEKMPLWMSEVGAGGSGFSGNINLAQKLINDMRFIAPSAWIDWQYIEENNDQWCLVKALSFAEGKYQKVRNYSVRSHFSRYIKSGYTILTSLNSKSLVALSPKGDELVIVAINSSGISTDHTADLSMFESVGSDIKGIITDENKDMANFDGFELDGKNLRFTLPDVCVVTLVVPVKTSEPVAEKIESGHDYFVCPRTSADVALTATDGAVTVSTVSQKDSQIWKLSESDGGYIFTNLAGDIITEQSPEYALISSKEPGAGQVFKVAPVGMGYYRIANSDESKAFDLEGENSSDGTKVGVWEYGDNAAPVHRQWAFVNVPGHNTNQGVESIFGNDNDEPFPLVFANTEVGVLAITPLDNTAGAITIYNASGITLWEGEIRGETLYMPLAGGYYVVSFDRAGKHSARPVFVK